MRAARLRSRRSGVLARGAVVAVVIALGGLGPTIAVSAQPEVSGESAADPDGGDDGGTGVAEPALAMGFDSLGLGGSIGLTGARGSASVTVPIIPGTTPRALRANVEIPPGIDRGWIDVADGDRSVGRLDLPVGAVSAPVTIALDGMRVVDDTVTLRLKSTVLPAPGVCLLPGDGDTVRLQNPVVDLVGVPTVPAVVADFLPPVLSRLTIFVAGQPTGEESSAALRLATSVVHRYGAQRSRVVVRPVSELATAPVDGPLDRSAVLRTGPDAAVQLTAAPGTDVPRLEVTGSGTALVEQVNLLTSAASVLAVAAGASVDTAATVPVLASDSATLRDMGLGSLSASGQGQVTVTIPVDQTRLGRLASGVRVHLLGSYTPLSADIAGSITASIGDTGLAVWPTDAFGIIDRWVDIPPYLTGRVSAIDVAMRTSGNGDACGTGGSLSLTIDENTTVTSSAGAASPDVRGFASVPQALMPDVAVALTEQTFAETVHAVSILTGLQRLSARVLSPNVIGVDEVLAGSLPGVIVDPTGFDSDALVLPLSTTGTTELTLLDPTAADNAAVRVSIDSSVPFASLQVARDDRGRTLMIATSTDRPQLDALLGWLDSDPGRWDRLTGDVLFGAGAREPVSLSSRFDTAADEPVARGSTAPAGVYALLAFGVVALLFGALAAVAVFVRSRGKRDEVDGPPAGLRGDGETDLP